MKILMLLLPMFFLNCSLVKHSSAPKRLINQTPTIPNNPNKYHADKIKDKDADGVYNESYIFLW
jgi:hypothetical protein